MNTTSQSFLAIDLGASSGRALVGSLASIGEGPGEVRIRFREVHRFAMPVIEKGERLFWDLEQLEAQVGEGLRRGVEAAPDLRSVSVDSWAVDYVPLGEDGNPLRNPYSYRDPRTRAVMEEALQRVSAEEIYAVTGIQFMPINTLYQVLADYEMEPDLVRRTRLRLPIADYLHYRMCGRPAAELSMASTTQLMDVRTRAWAEGLMRRFGIDPGAWPQIVPPATRLGRLRLEDGEESGVEVVAGCSHDTACAVAAVPADESAGTWAYVSCGTWALLGVERAEPILTDEAREAGFTNELGLDGTVRFLKNLTGLWVLQECERAWRKDGERFDYDDLLREAEGAPSCGGVIDLNDPYFAERGGMPEKVRRHCRERGFRAPERRGDFVRLIFKSMAAGFGKQLRVLEALTGERVDRLHIVGGGSQSALLCRWTADAIGRSVVAGPAEATAFGNLLIQARVSGALPGGRSIRSLVRTGIREVRVYEPATTEAEN